MACTTPKRYSEARGPRAPIPISVTHGLTSPLSLSTMTTLSGSHVIAGAAVAMSSLGSAVGIAMMMGGGGAPLLAAWLGPDWMRTPGWAPS